MKEVTVAVKIYGKFQDRNEQPMYQEEVEVPKLIPMEDFDWVVQEVKENFLDKFYDIVIEGA